MFDPDTELDAAAAMLERRWFATMTAVRLQQAECEALREIMEMSARAWRQARNELVRLESIREALGEALAEREGRHSDARAPAALGDCRVPSAA